jgi:hypothetical protein
VEKNQSYLNGYKMYLNRYKHVEWPGILEKPTHHVWERVITLASLSTIESVRRLIMTAVGRGYETDVDLQGEALRARAPTRIHHRCRMFLVL